MAVHRQQVEPRDIPKRFGGVSRQHVCAKVAKLSEDIIDDADRLQLKRAANLLAGVKEQGCYTDWELQAAVFDCSSIAALAERSREHAQQSMGSLQQL